jgi:hypothetical protein
MRGRPAGGRASKAQKGRRLIPKSARQPKQTHDQAPGVQQGAAVRGVDQAKHLVDALYAAIEIAGLHGIGG